MASITESIDVNVPVSTAYNQWTQFETFPQFMGGVESVTQIDDTRTHWVTDIAGVEREFDAEISEQHPDERVAWRSVGGEAKHAGVVTFHRLDDAKTRVMVQIVDPQASTEAQAEHLRLLVGLSAAETRVAALLGGGLGLPETARALGVSLSTVKTHAKRIFHKADVHSSAALVRLLLSIPIGPSRP